MYKPETVDQKIARWEKEVSAIKKQISVLHDHRKIAEAELHNAETEKRAIERNRLSKRECINLLKKHPYLIVNGDRNDITKHEHQNNQFYIICDYPGIDIEDENSPNYIEADGRSVWREDNGNHWDQILTTLLKIIEIVQEQS